MIKLDHLVLQATDFSSALEFYRLLFEFTHFAEILDPESDKSFGFRQSDGLTFWIEAASDNLTIKPKAGSLDHYAFNCENRDEVDRAYKFCRSKEWRILSEPKAYPQYGDFYGFAFEGPDGLKLEFVTH